MNDISISKVKVRFAPSPTGALHIGSARTALFNYVFAKQNNGSMALRIEDTDKERSKREFEDNILEVLKWLGIEWDEFSRQSERGEIYSRYLRVLVDSGAAYVSKEEPKNEGDRGEVIRFKNPNTTVSFDDMIRGQIEVDISDLGDFVVAKDFNTPLYHLAAVVDDALFGVSHVIRGEDGLSNTPRQILLQRALGFSTPIYAHLPFILGPDKTKMSKRHGAVSVTEYRDSGYFKETMINFLATLGWSSQSGLDNLGSEELFDIEELIRMFRLENVTKGAAVFNIDKLNWLNREYLKKLSDKTILLGILPFVPEDFKKDNNCLTILSKIVPILRERINKYEDVIHLFEAGEVGYFFAQPVYDKSMLKTVKYIPEVVNMLEKIKTEEFNSENIKGAIWDFATKVGRGDVLWPMRVALTGLKKSPDPFIVGEILGKEETLGRLKYAISYGSDSVS